MIPAPVNEKSALKRARPSQGEQTDPKKPRRSNCLQPSTHDHLRDDHLKNDQLPTPETRGYSDVTSDKSTADNPKERATTPPSQIPSDESTRNLRSAGGLSSPPTDTQPFSSQFVFPPESRTYAVEDEIAEGVWGYLLPFDGVVGANLVLKRRSQCPVPGTKVKEDIGDQKVPQKTYTRKEEEYEKEKAKNGVPAGGYLLGRHPECDRIINAPTVSNRHCLLFNEIKAGHSIAVLEDLSGNGTFVNDSIVGRNKRRELKDGDEISILDAARYIFRAPMFRETNGFRNQYVLKEQLGKGHFASVYLCVDKSTGTRYAVKKFEKRTSTSPSSGASEKSKVEGLQQEIAVLMGVSHPSLLCLIDTFDEEDGVYLVLELAAEGELFNWIVLHQKLTEAEARKVFIQLFQGVKYLHERNIVHRDIKPENILLTDKELHVKLADFGLAKIIGEESFTTTLCGTPSYVAPEIIENSNHRRYTRAVDVWSLGVVLYICLCGFPPFSDELCSADNPLTLSQQIRMAKFDYPSPYWDSVGDPALDLIDRMLTVDPEKRFTIDECLEHPWTTCRTMEINPNDSTDGLTGAIASLDFSRRKVHRERTLLASINEVRVAKEFDGEDKGQPVKVYEKNKPLKEEPPAGNRAPGEFIQLGGKGDPQLYENDDGSRYMADDVAAVKQARK